jgi:hypothetical protein
LLHGDLFPSLGVGLSAADACFILLHSLACFSTLKIKAKYSSEKPIGFQRTTRLYVL